MTTSQRPAVTVHHHPEHGLTHVIPTNGGHDYWVRHADGAFGILTAEGAISWGYLVGQGELEIIESLADDPVVLDAIDREYEAEGLSEFELLEIFSDERRAS
ncbi:MAG TPA: hypothetical protein VGL59_11540 [Polyangia bacterium]|jgi:hypothetical protein